MPERRRYTKRQKVVAISAAMASSVKAAADQLAIPERTLGYWMEMPEFAELRSKTREDLAGEMSVIAHIAASELAKALRSGKLEPRDLIIALGVAVDKAQLLSGAATSRTETKALSDGLNDHEKQQLRDALDRLLSETAPADETGVAVGVGAEVRQ